MKWHCSSIEIAFHQFTEYNFYSQYLLCVLLARCGTKNGDSLFSHLTLVRVDLAVQSLHVRRGGLGGGGGGGERTAHTQVWKCVCRGGGGASANYISAGLT